MLQCNSMLYHKLIIKGKVQGVGFRPYVFNLAKKLQLKGYVKNKGNSVEILLSDKKELFLKQLHANLPQQAKITSIYTQIKESKKIYTDFLILQSKSSKTTLQGILPQDVKICDACIKDMQQNPRFQDYAFSACADCGPRYSILHQLPYDRNNTTMRDFLLCEQCNKDYHDPKNRRFHAQPLSCKHCKIPLYFHYKQKTFYDEEALKQCALAIQEGAILAIKGIGGFAIVCDALNQDAIKHLRIFKRRPLKPFAIMAKDIAMAKKYAHINKQEEFVLKSPQAPIVLLKKRKALFDIAPLLHTIGIVLPYSPLHLLLFENLNNPIIFTSANLTQEPIIANQKDLQDKLGGLCDGILDYQREISNPIDDSVVQIVNEKLQILRLARGYAPLHLHIPQLKESKKVKIGMGAEQKITLAFSQGKNIMLSPFIGDLNNPASLRSYEKTFDLFKTLYHLKPHAILSDAHPDYHSYQISANKSLNDSILWEKVQHHYAHFCAIFADAMLQDLNLYPKEKCLGIIWDGSGLGKNQEIWGGEFFFGNLSSYKRVGHFESMQIFGGEKSIKEIYKIGYGIAKGIHTEASNYIQQRYQKQYPHLFPLFDTLITKQLQSFHTTSVGRIFDAIASLCEICDLNTYDAQAPMMLESLYQEHVEYGIYPYKITQGIIQTKGLFKAVIQDIYTKKSKPHIATKFINTLAQIALDFALKFHAKKVLFSGGVFMNKALCQRIAKIFSKHQEMQYYFHSYLPSNDSNISLGQALARLKTRFKACENKLL